MNTQMQNGVQPCIVDKADEAPHTMAVEQAIARMSGLSMKRHKKQRPIKSAPPSDAADLELTVEVRPVVCSDPTSATAPVGLVVWVYAGCSL